ncbi:MAG TPA: hypothetical protein PKJ37_06665 [Acidobacteriota bacterium]|nr:hypothetical protein [Acidobacteriota bacterium]HNT17557.1 hypothetical protein [Acidobacteriota bacterium]
MESKLKIIFKNRTPLTRLLGLLLLFTTIVVSFNYLLASRELFAKNEIAGMIGLTLLVFHAICSIGLVCRLKLAWYVLVVVHMFLFAVIAVMLFGGYLFKDFFEKGALYKYFNYLLWLGYEGFYVQLLLNQTLRLEFKKNKTKSKIAVNP